MNKFLVMHDYGQEGWKIQAESNSMYEAVMAREADMENGGGHTMIVERLELLDAYRRADYDRPKVQDE